VQIELIEGVNKHVFGEGLDVVEQQWLVSELNGWLEGSRGSPVDIDTTEDRAQVPLPAACSLPPAESLCALRVPTALCCRQTERQVAGSQPSMAPVCPSAVL
jgi:hypothetical protein